MNEKSCILFNDFFAYADCFYGFSLKSLNLLAIYVFCNEVVSIQTSLFFCSTVLQLCYNQFTGSVPTQLGSLTKLSVLALQSNQLTGAIPASLGNLGMLVRLDLSFNHLFGSIPTKLADAPLLEVIDIRNNTLSGSVPPGKIDNPCLLYSF